MTTAQVVETSVTVNNNSHIQDYIHPDDQTQPTFVLSEVKNESCLFNLTRKLSIKKCLLFLRYTTGEANQSASQSSACNCRILSHL